MRAVNSLFVMATLSFACTYLNVQAQVARSVALPKAAQERYQIGRDDILALNFPLSPEMNQTVTVQPDGYISLAAVSGVKVLGLSVPQAQLAIIDAYKEVLHQPILEIDLKDFQKPIYTVFGQVNHPGQFELRRETNLAEAMAVSGGLNTNSKTQVFLLRHVPGDEAKLEVSVFNLRKVLQGKNPNSLPHLQQGDIIFVPEKFITKFKKYISYSGIDLFSPTQVY